LIAVERFLVEKNLKQKIGVHMKLPKDPAQFARKAIRNKE